MKGLIVIALIAILPVANADVLIEAFLGDDAESASINEFLMDGNFHYIIFPSENVFTKIREENYNATYPDVFIDGGYAVVRNADEIENAVNLCEERNKSISIDIKAQWIQCPCQKGMSIDVNVKSREKYEGILFVYIVEVNSRWKDGNGWKFTYSFLEFAHIENISIDGKEYSASFIWGPNFPDVYTNKNNIGIIAAVYSKEWHIKYADPPDKRPFKAHYLDGFAVYIPSDTPPYISIVYPREGYFYILGREILKMPLTLIIGGIKGRIIAKDDHGIEKNRIV